MRPLIKEYIRIYTHIYICMYMYIDYSLKFHLNNGCPITYTLYSTLETAQCVHCVWCLCRWVYVALLSVWCYISICVYEAVCVYMIFSVHVFVELCVYGAAGIRTWHLILGTHAAELKYTVLAAITPLGCISESMIKLKNRRKGDYHVTVSKAFSCSLDRGDSDLTALPHICCFYLASVCHF